MIQKGKIYQHIKSGNLYMVEDFAYDSRTEGREKLVVYRALYGDCDLWIREYFDFQNKFKYYRRLRSEG